LIFRKESKNSQTIGIEARSGEASALATTGKARTEGIRRDILSSEEESFNSTILRLRSKTTP
jgi:hypothetical protein